MLDCQVNRLVGIYMGHPPHICEPCYQPTAIVVEQMGEVSGHALVFA